MTWSRRDTMDGDDCRQMSAWKKGAILNAIMDATMDPGLPVETAIVLGNMPLVDLRAIFLRWAYSAHAGWVDGDTEGRPGRWTNYYELDMDAVRSLMEGGSE